MNKKKYVQPQLQAIGIQPSVIMEGSPVGGSGNKANDTFDELSRKRGANTGETGIWKESK